MAERAAEAKGQVRHRTAGYASSHRAARGLQKDRGMRRPFRSFASFLPCTRAVLCQVGLAVSLAVAVSGCGEATVEGAAPAGGAGGSTPGDGDAHLVPWTVQWKLDG